MYKTLSGPLIAQVEVSTRCTNRCLHCYNFWRKDDVHMPLDNLSIEGVGQVMQQLISSRVFHVVFTGGEPLLNKHVLFHGIEMANNANVTVGLNSNLIPLTLKDAKRLKKLGVINVITSLMGPSADTHDKIAQLQGAFDKTIQGIRLLQKNEIPVTVNMVVSLKNKHLLRDTALFVKSLGINRFNSTRAGCPGNCNDFSEFSLGLQDFRDYLKELYNIGEQEKIATGVLESYPLCAIKEIRQYSSFTGRHCLAGVTTLTVATNGEVRPCSHLDISYGNMFQENLSHIWSRMKEWRDGSLLPSSCRSCKILLMCGGGCRMEAKMRNGSLKSIDPYATPDDVEYVMSEFSRIESQPQKTLPLNFRLNPEVRWRIEEFGSVVFTGPRLRCYLNTTATEMLKKLQLYQIYKTDDFLRHFGDNVGSFLTELYDRQVLIASN